MIVIRDDGVAVEEAFRIRMDPIVEGRNGILSDSYVETRWTGRAHTHRSTGLSSQILLGAR